MNDLVFYLDQTKTKKGETAEKFSFIVAGVTLLLSVYDTVSKPFLIQSFIDKSYLLLTGAAGLLNIVFAIVINKINPETRKIFIYRMLLGISGLILITDAINKIMHNYQSLQYLLLFAGFLYFSVALFYNDMQKQKMIKLNNKGILLRKSFLKKDFFVWNEINSIQLEEKRVIIILKNGNNYFFKIFFKANESSINFENKLKEEASKRNIKLIGT